MSDSFCSRTDPGVRLLEQPRLHDLRSLGFNRSKRLPGARDYKAVFDHSTFRASHKNALVLARLNQNQHARLGQVISKKNVRRAVDRNQIKRLLREHFRLRQDMLSGLDIIFMAKQGLAGLEKKEIRKVFESLFNHIQKQNS